MPVTKFTRKNAKELHAALAVAVEEVCAKFGVDVTLGNIRFTPDSARTAIIAAVGKADVGGKLDDERVYADNFRRIAVRHYGYFKDEDLGATVKVNNEDYTIVGWRGRAKCQLAAKNTKGELVGLNYKDVMAARTSAVTPSKKSKAAV